MPKGYYFDATEVLAAIPPLSRCFRMETEIGNVSGIEANTFISIRDRLPRFGLWVRVATPYAIHIGFLCLGGIWRDARDGTRIEQVESWQPLNTETAQSPR